MANTIKLKRSNSAGAIPSSLNPGELAVNTADRRLTLGNNSSVVVCPAAGVMTGTDYPLNPLTGQVFFNTTSTRLYIYNGSSWIEVTAGSSSGGAIKTYEYTATQGQTTFSGSDNNSNILSYVAGFLDVFVNGVRLTTDDYTATSETSVVLADALDEDDEVAIMAYQVVDVLDTYSIAQADVQFAPYTRSRKNLLINGCFRVWQRGTSTSASGWGAPDRWGHLGTTSTWTVSRQAFTAGQTGVPGEPRYYLRDVVTTGGTAGSYHLLRQSIEDVRIAAGQTVTLSFWAKANAGKNIAVEFMQYFGTSGSTAVSAIGAQKVALTTSWARYSVTVDIPSIKSKTIDDTTGDHGLYVSLWMDAGSDFNTRTDSLGNQSGIFYFSNVQLEIGDAVTDFEYRPIGEEIQLCQRYYQKSYAIDTVPGTNTANGVEPISSYAQTTSQIYGGKVVFGVPMRAAPTPKAYLQSGTADQIQVSYKSSSVNGTATFWGAGQSGFGVYSSSLSGSPLTIGEGIIMTFHWTADAEF